MNAHTPAISTTANTRVSRRRARQLYTKMGVHGTAPRSAGSLLSVYSPTRDSTLVASRAWSRRVLAAVGLWEVMEEERCLGEESNDKGLKQPSLRTQARERWERPIPTVLDAPRTWRPP